VSGRFECPCHGSKYSKAGKYIEGPAPRSLDRMPIRFVDGSNQVAAQSDAQATPLQAPSDTTLNVVIDTGKVVPGDSHG
jgi:cytochrome b6-f complex iron-sulfur subunit